MPPIANLAKSTIRIVKTAHRAVRQRFWVLAVTILGICAPVYAMAWYLNVYDNVALSVVASFIVSVLPIAILVSPPSSLKSASYLTWLAAGVLIGLVLFIGENRDSRFLSFSAMFMIVMLPWSWIFWQIVRHEMILVPGFALALVAILIYWAGALVKDELTFDLLLLPLPLILVAAVVWAPVASLALKIARRNKNDRIRGPATQALAMGTLFLPATLVSFTIPGVFELSDPWSAACVTIVGVIIGAVISEPLKNLFVEWANLSRDQQTPVSPNPNSI